MRDERWLHQLLDETWDSYFSDIPQDNIVRIRFGRKAKTRLGSIMVDHKESDVSIITINGLFRDPEIPDYVIQATIFHELSHYAHGFNSPIKQQHAHPHAGGVMRTEFSQRGAIKLYKDQKSWLKSHWRGIVLNNFDKKLAKTSVVRKTTKVPNPFWF
ncbi:MAG TPA: hypothetical protein VLE72_00270 [Candidatus Saccharimonadales bacterium]|nr:hypothetical protein [Candidatus Saccharimonadales bacterium]